MTLAIVLFLVGLALSAFFSGTETGLYRVPRTRLVLDGLSGSRGAQALIWLLNHPSIFVATTLVGNNTANYVTSFAAVMGISQVFGGSTAAEMLGPVMMTPIVFVFGELLPKSLFFQAPFRLLRVTRPLLLFATVIFAPVTLVLGMLGNVLRGLTGKTPFQLQMAMARDELDQLLRAGHEAGILAAGQRSLAQRLFEVGNRPAVAFGVRQDRLAVIDVPVIADEARHQARRRNHPIVLVRRAGRIVGFLRYMDLCVGDPKLEPKPVIHGKPTDRHLKILLKLYDKGSDVAVLADDRNAVGIVVTRRQLLQPLIK